MRLLMVINPVAGPGSGSKERLAARLEAHLSSLGHDVAVSWTAHAGHATEIARAAVADGHYDGLLAVGGDGTVNETAQGLVGSAVPLGIIPVGSGNGLARHLGLPQGEPLWAADVVARGHDQAIDLARADGRICTCTCGVGFDAATAHRFSHEEGRGLITYIRSAVAEYRRREAVDYSLRIDGRTVEERAAIVAVCNASQWGNNAYIAPQASVRDGLLDVVVVRPASTGANMLTALEVMTAWLRPSPRVAVYRGADIVITRAGMDSTMLGHIDGEPVRVPSRLEVKCLPGALRVFTPERKKDLRPLISPLESMANEGRGIINEFFSR